MCSWDIIFWDSDNAVDYVPSSWANKTKTQYKWPSDLKGLRGIINRCEDLERTFKWCDATFKKTCNVLRDAQYYSRKGESKTYLGTDENERITLSAGKATRRRSSSSSETDEPIWKKPHYDYAENDTTPFEMPSSSQSGSSTTTIATNSLSNIALQNIILEMHLNIKMLMKKQDKMELLLTAKGIIFPETNDIFEILPLKSEADVLKMEAYLNESNENYNKMVNLLGKVGGDTFSHTVSMGLRKIFSKELAMKYSGFGKKGKLNFSELKLRGCLHKAIHNRYNNLTEHDITKKISMYLATARDRDGGRKKRSNK